MTSFISRKPVRIYIASLLAVLLLLAGWSSVAQARTATVPQVKFETADAYLIIEFLDDDLIHFETNSGSAPTDEAPIPTSPMVQKTIYPGPSELNDDGQGTITTADLQLVVNPQDLCVTVTDLTRDEPLLLTAVCPQDLDKRRKSLTIDPASTQNVYGLGEKFRTPGEPNGDWVGGEREIGTLGNEMESFSDGAVGNAQFPVMYALGPGLDNYALFVDVVFKQDWEFIGDSWTMTSPADVLRWYFMSGPDLPDLRADYMELVGRPLVPPKAFLGLWVSEYGYDNWAELDDKRQSLNDNHFPQDGFVLDLQWFGDVQIPSQMGSISWDLDNFPDPDQKIAQLQSEEGVGIVVIEESYVDQDLSNFGRMASQSYLVKTCETCGPAILRAWWGLGGMVDWTNEAGAAFWHDTNRQPLIDMGVLGHWTDLGEPEMAAPNSWYAGLPGLDLHDQISNHNIYNLKWAESIYQGYIRNDVLQRPAILSRSGTSGIDRYGVMMWSADIGSNFPSLAAHMNAQMNMSLSGMDYFGSDIGGFHRGTISGAALDELYTVWFANSTLLDVPVRPHTENLCNCKETAPDRVGDLDSNLANIRLRYALSPYLYSLAHRAYLTGAPVVPPLFFYYQADPETRPLGDHKMLGRDILVRTVTQPDVTETAVYLPAGTWVNDRTGQWIESSGQWLENVPTIQNGLFQLPIFLRAGAIIPQMYVDDQTMNLYGMRRDGTTRDELIVQVIPSPDPTTFVFYEDDGSTIAYQSGDLRQTEISQQWQDDQITVQIAPAVGTYANAPDERGNVLHLSLGDTAVTAVTLDNNPLTQYPSRTEWETAESGWFLESGSLWAKTGSRSVADAKQFVVSLAETAEPTPEPISLPTPTPGPDLITDPPATPNRVPLIIGSGIVIVSLFLGGWFYYRRRNTS
ncbi:MAG: TIM-barrel domain-containing protein [Candidatus Promineifilaceae bacterium]